uniref:Uncharacterized protein n=1 Tax=Kalanchoe fedtschenkoi TaxID=63787 RepID=A0A7N0TVZ6_KALFE
MSGLGSERERPWSWSIYTSSHPNPPQAQAQAPTPDSPPSPPHRDSYASMNAISFGLVATAILISMFFIMAIFEHLFKPAQPDPHALPSSSAMQKPPISSEPDPALCMSGFSVLMPGQRCPTHIAKPASFPTPCAREGVNWPQHDHQQQHVSHFT